MLGNSENNCEAISVNSYVSNAALQHDGENEDMPQTSMVWQLAKETSKGDSGQVLYLGCTAAQVHALSMP